MPSAADRTARTSATRAAAPTDPVEVVKAFLDALRTFDVDAARELLDPDVVYQNVPLPPARGRDAVEKQLQGFKRFAKAFDVVYHNVAADGGTVLTERTDIITVGKVPAAFWVCGTFEVRDGRITLWRDRFDWVNFTASFPKGAAKALMRRIRR